MIKKALTSGIIILLLFMPAAAKENKDDNKDIPRLSASLNLNKAHVGDTVLLTLKYYIPDDAGFTPKTEIKGLEKLTVIDRKIEKSKIILTLLIDKDESFDIGPFEISYINKEKETNIIKSEKLRMEVLSNLGDKPAEAKLKPLEDIIPTYPLWLKYLPWISIALIIILIVAVFLWWRKRKNRQMLELMDEKLPHIIAREELERLKALNLIEKGEFKEFYFRFSEILRRYLEKLRGFPAAEFTTEEIARRIKDERDRKMLSLLRDSDMVKFADAEPTKAKNEEDIRNALAYIKDTTPVPQIADHANPGAGEGRA